MLFYQWWRKKVISILMRKKLIKFNIDHFRKINLVVGKKVFL